ncbi:MAG: hypothetical protein ACI4EF_12685, partial [Coprococcus sp.]
MKTLKKVMNIKGWQKRTKINMCVVLVVLIIAAVLAVLKPNKQEMLAHTSDSMQELIAKDQESSRKRVTT